MLDRIRIQGFKSLSDVDVSLAPLVVVFGPNAVGKSNFLEALMLLSRTVTERTLADALGGPLRGYPMEVFSLPADGLPGLLSMERVRLRLDAWIRPASGAPGVHYGIGIQMRPAAGELGVFHEYLATLTKDGRDRAPPRIEPADDGAHLLIRQKGKAGAPAHGPTGLNHSLASNLQYAGADRYPALDLLREELAAWRIYYLDPRTAMREAQPPREVTDIGAQGEWIAPFLYRLKQSPAHRKYFGAIRRTLRSTIPSIEDIDVELDRQRGTLDVQIQQSGTRYSSRVISEGTLRVLALCAIAANPWPGSLIAFEEPENGVHPRRIEVAAELLHSMALGMRRQVIVTTHSPILLSTLVKKWRERPDSIRMLLCSRTGTRTTIAPFEPPGALFDDAGIRDGLRSDEEDHLVEAMLLRGWLDG